VVTGITLHHYRFEAGKKLFKQPEIAIKIELLNDCLSIKIFYQYLLSPHNIFEQIITW
jgi:hypothetical protein